MKYSSLLLSFVVYLLFNSCSNTSNPTDIDKNTAVIERLDKLGDSLTSMIMVAGKNKSIPGAIIGVYNPSSNLKYLKSFGKADISRDFAMSRNDEFRIGTLTHTFIATLAFDLIDDNIISLDDAVSKYINVPHSGNEIKISHLLAHKSGIPDFMDSVKFYQLSEPKRKFSDSELIGFAFAQAESFRPTSNINISNTNYLLLGKILESAGGKNLQNLVQSRILTPLFLTHTNFDINSSFKSSLFSKGYLANESGNYVDVTNLYDFSWSWASANMTSNSTDMIYWLEKLVLGGIISGSSTNKMLNFEKLYTKNGLEYYYGMGVMKIGSFVGYSGEIAGYSTSMYMLPDNKTKIFIFTNTENNNDTLLIKIAQILFPGLR